MEKIKMLTPLVEMDGDEMTRILWKMIKDELILPCATITPNAQRMTEYNLHEMWKSPNGTIRAMMDGTVFRTPITIPSIHPAVKFWKKPITIARHAYGDIYRDVEIQVNEPGTAKLVFDGVNGQHEEVVVHEFKGPGVLLGQHNLRPSGSPPRTPSPRSTTAASRPSSTRCSRSTRRSSRPPASSTSTP